ncbi:MAG: DUF4276 family protein [Magnetococcales bacterium]|nr:DUF4276 family protein [Magnetococcales bacterium]
MHFEILVEDQSGQAALDILLPKILGGGHTHRVIAYKGVGRIPSGLKGTTQPNQRILLDQLPRLLRGYGSAHAKAAAGTAPVVIVVCDLDDKCLKPFRAQLYDLANACLPAPRVCFCIAIEEGEAWLLGDLAAIRRAYPDAQDKTLRAYVNDAICGTWEKLADAIHPNGSAWLRSQGWQSVGTEKCKWARNIAPHMDVDRNQSPSFVYFREKLRQLASGQITTCA